MIENFESGHSFFREGSSEPFVYVDRENKEVYVYSLKKWYSFEEAKTKWPSPCDIPGGAGV